MVQLNLLHKSTGGTLNKKLIVALTGVLLMVVLASSASVYAGNMSTLSASPECHFFTNIARNVCIDSDTTTPTSVVSTPSLVPSNTPTLLPPVTPTNTVLPTVTFTTTVVVPTKTSTSVPTTVSTVTTQPPTQTVGSGMWITSAEIMSLPMSGVAWTNIKSVAYGSWGTPDLKNQDNKHAINTLAGALVYARTGDAVLAGKVRDGIIAAKRTLDESSEWQTTNGVLAAGRQIGAYVISADLINLKKYDPTADAEFRNWLSVIRTTNIGTHSRWKSLSFTCENSTNNWGAFACASRIAASIYVGDTADVQRSSLVIRAYFGERSVYPVAGSYFQHTADYSSTWACNEATWTGINPGCIKSGVNIDGVLVEDASRGGACCVLQGAGISYSWEALQGTIVSSELLYRIGNYDPYNWSNQALKRAIDMVQRSGWGITSPAYYVPWLANFRYGTKYVVANGGNGRIMSWGDWLYNR